MIDKQTIEDWLEFLKNSYGVNYSDVAKASGISRNRLQSLKIGRTIVKPDDLRRIAIAYPVLRDRAKALGIDPNPQDEADVQHLTNEQADELESALLKEIRTAIAAKDGEIERLRAENDRLLSIIERLTTK